MDLSEKTSQRETRNLSFRNFEIKATKDEFTSSYNPNNAHRLKLLFFPNKYVKRKKSDTIFVKDLATAQLLNKKSFNSPRLPNIKSLNKSEIRPKCSTANSPFNTIFDRNKKETVFDSYGLYKTTKIDEFKIKPKKKNCGIPKKEFLIFARRYYPSLFRSEIVSEDKKYSTLMNRNKTNIFKDDNLPHTATCTLNHINFDYAHTFTGRMKTNEF